MDWHVAVVDHRIVIAGELRLADAAAIWRELETVRNRQPGARLDVDLSAVDRIDGAVMALLVDCRARLVANGVACELVAVPAHLTALVHLHGGDQPTSLPGPPVHGTPLEVLGDRLAALVSHARELLVFLGELIAAHLRFVRRTSRANWRELPALIVRAGTDAIVIVAVLNFLIGFVMAFQAARQLELYGANIYVSDIVGISVTRELAPLMTAIILAGRSGAAFAAELGTMRVSEELDALRVMGLPPVPYLAVPRVWSLALVAPLLVVIGDLSGILGGLAVARDLDVQPAGYFAELRTAVVPSDVWTGLVKCFAFGTAIGIIGCHHGFATKGAAAGVGRSTTATVVSCLFAIVIIDALFTMVFRAVGV